MTKTADVVILGSGAGGAAVAYGLARAGVQVLVLEAGPRYDYLEDYRLHRNDWERTGFPEKVPTAGRQTYAPLQPLESRWDDLRSWNRIRGRGNPGPQRSAGGGYQHTVGVGGSTLYFTGEYHRLNPASMQMHSRFGVAADWPVSYEELESFYVEAEHLVGTSGSDSDHRRPRSKPYPLPPLPLSHASKILGKGFAQRGLRYEHNPLAVLSRAYDARPPCNFCGNCNRGCPRGDKGSADLTFMRHAEATSRCEVLTGAQVTRLVRGAGDRVSQVIYRDPEGVERAVDASVVIAACGAVETPRLLLNSGVGTDSGQVGRHFMETLSWTSIGVHPRPLGSHRGHPADGICWDFNDPQPMDGIIGGFRLGPDVAESNLVGPINYAARVVGDFGLAHKRAMRATFGQALGVGAIGESLPDPRSFVDLDPQEKDRHGMPKARIHSFLAERELERLSAMAKTCRSVLEASGVGELIEESGSYDAFGASHVFGTCRMGRDAENSVVDPFGRVHGLRNLFIADGSVFPSSGGGESPSLTIAALALRTAAYIQREKSSL
jgi:choline dehydrogenase-like flavoprotein